MVGGGRGMVRRDMGTHNGWDENLSALCSSALNERIRPDLTF